MLDCLLINSPSNLNEEHHFSDPKVPLGLLHIAAALAENGLSTEILDCHTRRCELTDIVKSVKDASPRLVGINISTPNRKVVFEIINEIKDSFHDTPVVVGGPHATSFPDDIFSNSDSLDAVIIGEGEIVIQQILESLPLLPQINGVYTKKDYLSKQPKRPASRILDPDVLPFPNFDLIDVQKYLSVSPELYISASRGCKYNCAFCSTRTLLGHEVIGRSANQVIEQMVFLRSKYGVSSFYFFDENIFLWPDFHNFCAQMVGCGLRWTAHGTMNDINGINGVREISQSGCYRVSFGFESGSPKIQKYMAKVIPEHQVLLIPEFKAAGVETRGYFVVGVPDESVDDFVHTLLYLIRLNKLGLTDVAVFPARPYPGTRLFQDCVNIFGEEAIPKLLEFSYLEDWKCEKDAQVSGKLKKYNTISNFQINKFFKPPQVRELVALATEVFFKAEEYEMLSFGEMRNVVLNTLRHAPH